MNDQEAGVEGESPELEPGAPMRDAGITAGLTRRTAAPTPRLLINDPCHRRERSMGAGTVEEPSRKEPGGRELPAWGTPHRAPRSNPVTKACKAGLWRAAQPASSVTDARQAPLLSPARVPHRVLPGPRSRPPSRPQWRPGRFSLSPPGSALWCSRSGPGGHCRHTRWRQRPCRVAARGGGTRGRDASSRGCCPGTRAPGSDADAAPDSGGARGPVPPRDRGGAALGPAPHPA